MSKISMTDFKSNPNVTVLKQLGKGAYGSVYQILDKTTNTQYAIKKIAITQGSADRNDDHAGPMGEGIPINALREIMILKKMKHENIITLHDIAYSKNYIDLYLEYCDMDLYHLINKVKSGEQSSNLIYNEHFVRKLAFQLIRGCEYLHSHCIIHRDWKPNNILLKSTDGGEINWDNVRLKIADFGLSRRFSIVGHPYTKEVLTLWYRAPELLWGSTIYNTSIDIWSIGCILAEMILGQSWFNGSTEIEQFKIIYSVFGTFTSDQLPGLEFFPGYQPTEEIKGIGLNAYIKRDWRMKVSEKWINWIESMWTINPNKRICLKEALAHAWFQDSL